MYHPDFGLFNHLLRRAGLGPVNWLGGPKTALVAVILGAFQVFALVMVLTGGGPLGATDLVVYRIYRTAWELLQFGDASALALLLFALLFGATWAQLKLLDRRVEHA